MADYQSKWVTKSSARSASLGTPGKDDDCAQAGIDKVADQLK
ncbi:MAG TPA: hypothetical protein VNY53_12545 [Bradyrhizobium sp.]|nr:hypothetical protein [Bradyrhizobium sp.]